jgi:serine/threonine-protein kinase
MSFESKTHIYRIHRKLSCHPDYETLLLASQKTKCSGRTSVVVLREVTDEPGPESQARIQEELRLGRYLNHPNIGAVYGFVANEGRLYIVTEHIPGCSLGSIIDMTVALGWQVSPGFAAYAAAEVADALDYAHKVQAAGRRPLRIVHRAVSPRHIRIKDSGGVMLTNFGAAYSELINRLKSAPTRLRGDPAYMAPEMVLRHMRRSTEQMDGRVDIFSLGLVLLEMLTARHPLDPSDVRGPEPKSTFPPEVQGERSSFLPLSVLAGRVLRFSPADVEKSATGVPEHLRRIITTAVQAEPKNRFQTAADMRDELRAFLHSRPIVFGPREFAAEVEGITDAANDGELAARPGMERGVLRTPRDMDRQEIR